jgi:hypothetical protein
MENGKEPRNMNITVRVTKSEYHKYKRLASFYFDSVSSWAHHLLKNHQMLTENHKLKILSKELLEELLDQKLRLRNELQKNMERYSSPEMIKRLQEKHLRVSEEILDLNDLKRRYNL